MTVQKGERPVFIGPESSPDEEIRFLEAIAERASTAPRLRYLLTGDLVAWVKRTIADSDPNALNLYIRHCAQLAQADRLGSDYADVAAANSRLAGQIAALAESLHASHVRYQKLEGDRDRLAGELAAEHRRIHATDADVERLAGELRHCERRYDEARELVKRGAEALAEAIRERDRFQDQAGDYADLKASHAKVEAEAIARAEERNAALESLANTEHNHAATHAELDRVSDELGDCERRLDQARRDAEVMAGNASQVGDDLARLVTLNGQLADERDALRSRLATSEGRRNQLFADCERLLTERDECRRGAADAVSTYQQRLDARVGEVSAERDRALSDRDDCGLRSQGLARANNELARQRDQISAEYEGYQVAAGALETTLRDQWDRAVALAEHRGQEVERLHGDNQRLSAMVETLRADRDAQRQEAATLLGVNLELIDQRDAAREQAAKAESDYGITLGHLGRAVAQLGHYREMTDEIKGLTAVAFWHADAVAPEEIRDAIARLEDRPAE